MTQSVINLDEFKNGKFDKKCLQLMLVVSGLIVYIYCYFFLK